MLRCAGLVAAGQAGRRRQAANSLLQQLTLGSARLDRPPAVVGSHFTACRAVQISVGARRGCPFACGGACRPEATHHKCSQHSLLAVRKQLLQVLEQRAHCK